MFGIPKKFNLLSISNCRVFTIELSILISSEFCNLFYKLYNMVIHKELYICRN